MGISSRAGASALLLLTILGQTASQQASRSGPGFMWGNAGHVACGSTGETSRVAYEVMPSQFFGSNVIGGLLGASLDEDTERYVNPEAMESQKPELVAVLLGSKLETNHLSKLSDHQELDPLHRALASAKSSISVPHIESEASGSRMWEFMAGASTVASTEWLTIGSCGNSSAPLIPGDVSGAVETMAASKGGVLVVCGQSAEDLAEEMSILEELTGALDTTGKQHVVLYLPDQQPTPSRPAARLLQETVIACDSECKAFVYAIEAAIVLLLVLVAMLCGMACHNMMEAPSKFETPKAE